MTACFEHVCATIQSVRVTHIDMEYDLQAQVAAAFDKAGIPFEKGYRLGSHYGKIRA